jgi:hypothetical protein
MPTPYLGSQIEVLMGMTRYIRSSTAWLRDCVKMIGGDQTQHLPSIESLAATVTGDLENLSRFYEREANHKTARGGRETLENYEHHRFRFENSLSKLNSILDTLLKNNQMT